MSPPPADAPPLPKSPRVPQLAARGSLAVVPPDVVLRFCEHVRFSGTLAFEHEGTRGVLPMLNGVPEIVADNPKLERALDDFIVLEEGKYTLTQLLPTLEGATSDGDLMLRGSLETTSVADLLHYCERAGLTGNLTLLRDEDECVVRYDRGEMVSITVPGEAARAEGGEQDLSGVFAWAKGTFGVRAKSVFDRERKVTEPHQAAFLKSLEMALADVFEKSERGAAVAHPLRAPAIAPSILRGSTLPFGVEEPAPPAPIATPLPDAVDDDALTPLPATIFGSALPAPPLPTGIPLVPQLPGYAAVRPRSMPPPSRPRTEPPPPPGPETTVKIYFVDRGPSTRPSSTQHVTAKGATEVIQLDPGTASKGISALDADDAATTILRARGASENAGGAGGNALKESASVPGAAASVPGATASVPHASASVARPASAVANAPASAPNTVLTAVFAAAFGASVVGALWILVTLLR